MLHVSCNPHIGKDGHYMLRDAAALVPNSRVVGGASRRRIAKEEAHVCCNFIFLGGFCSLLSVLLQYLGYGARCVVLLQQQGDWHELRTAALASAAEFRWRQHTAVHGQQVSAVPGRRHRALPLKAHCFAAVLLVAL